MKAQDIINLLGNQLPKHTDYFSDQVTITSLTRSGSTVTAITSAAHELTTGDRVYVNDVKEPVEIDTLTLSNGIVTGTTFQPHDLTEGFNPYDFSSNAEVEILGANESEYNGVHTLLTTVNRKTFTYAISGSPASPATGTIILIDGKKRGYEGLKEITVVDPTTFTYTISGTPYTPASGSPVGKKNIRISGAANLQRAIDSYTKKNDGKYWAFVVLGDDVISKDRHILNDSTSTLHAGNDYRVRMIRSFTVFVFAPTRGSISARRERDTMVDIQPAIYKSLLGVKFTSNFCSQEKFQVTPLGTTLVEYNSAYLIYGFNFETNVDITYGDTIGNQSNVAFRDMTFDFENFTDTTLGVNLDEEPL